MGGGSSHLVQGFGLVTMPSIRRLFRRLFCGKKACHKTTNSKAANYGGVTMLRKKISPAKPREFFWGVLF